MEDTLTIEEMIKRTNEERQKQLDAYKYYTPDLNEFHVGFKYELYSDHNPKMMLQWNQETFKQNTNFQNVNRDIKLKKIRVKKLDYQDILDMGWIDGDNIHVISHYKLVYGKGTVKEIYKNYGAEKVFDGIIKNKSELIRIMKQVGITDNS